MRDSTLLFLIKKTNTTVTDICLAMKKRGFGAGRYNGYGGKVEKGETIEEAVIREVHEESAVDVGHLEKVGEIEFVFPHNPSFDQLVHIYVSSVWNGDPVETEEMKPAWTKVSDIPYTSMWPDDIYWLPKVLEGNKIKGKFTFGVGDVIVSQEVVVK